MTSAANAQLARSGHPRRWPWVVALLALGVFFLANVLYPSADADGEMLPSPDGKWIVGPPIAGTAHWSWAPDSSRILMNPNDPADGGQVLIDPADGSWEAVPWLVNAEPDWQRIAP